MINHAKPEMDKNKSKSTVQTHYKNSTTNKVEKNYLIFTSVYDASGKTREANDQRDSRPILDAVKLRAVCHYRSVRATDSIKEKNLMSGRKKIVRIFM